MKTTDLDGAGASRYYTVSKLGPNRSLTPEGYLLCESVPVARTGEMLYAQGEIVGGDGQAIDGDNTGIVHVSRGPDDLFRPQTIASFEGKPVTLSHPDEFVGPGNIRQHQVGTMFNVRRGTGIEDDLMLADLLITEQGAIKAVQDDGIEEVSNGYEADYDQAEPGRAVQRNIVGNHVALVERGRCGPRCAIGDEDMANKGGKNKFSDLLMRAFKAKDADEVKKLASEAESMDEDETEEEKAAREAKEKDAKTTDAFSAILGKLKSMDEDIQAIKKAQADDDDETEEENAARLAKEGKTGDEGDLTEPETAPKLDETGVKLYTGDAAKLIPSLAEILAPGTKIPTMDGKTTDAQRAQALCSCQRRALDTAYKTDDGKAAITPFLGGNSADFSKMSAPMVHAAFIGAASLMKARNNDGNRQVSVSVKDFGKTTDVASLNKTNREFWASKRQTAH